jgi:hypothetical protein
MVKMALVRWVNPAKFFRETSRTGRHHSNGDFWEREGSRICKRGVQKCHWRLILEWSACLTQLQTTVSTIKPPHCLQLGLLLTHIQLLRVAFRH